MFRKNLILISFLFLSVGNAWWATLYYNAATNTNWNTLTNWWQDSGFTIQATALPGISDDVIVSASVWSNTGGNPSINTLVVNGGTSLALNITVANGVTFNNSTRSTFGKTITGNVTFNNSSSHKGIITGNVVFNNSTSMTNSTINGDAIFNDSSRTIDFFSTITGTATFNDASSLGTFSSTVGTAIFNDSSAHFSVMTGNAVFNDSSTHNGEITGNVDVYYPSANPIGGIVFGTVTYHNYPDTTPPVQSAITVTPGITTATVTLTTNEITTATISYGPTSSYGTTATISWVAVTSHSGTISGLSSCGSTYHYQISTTDVANNTSSSTNATFITHCGSTGGWYSPPLPESTPTNESTTKTPIISTPKEEVNIPNPPILPEIPPAKENEITPSVNNPPAQPTENTVIFSRHFSVIKNDPSYASQLQLFFNKHEGESLTITGTYDQQTREAVNRFQLKYASEILAPWGITKPTGNVGVFTLAKINHIASQG